jgi:hypothetical protein
LTTLYLADAKHTDSWHAKKGDLQRASPLAIPIVPSSAFIAAIGSKRSPSDVFSPGEIIHFGSVEFITN